MIRVISRLRALSGDPTKNTKAIEALAAQLLHPERPGCHNQVRGAAVVVGSSRHGPVLEGAAAAAPYYSLHKGELLGGGADWPAAGRGRRARPSQARASDGALLFGICGKQAMMAFHALMHFTLFGTSHCLVFPANRP